MSEFEDKKLEKQLKSLPKQDMSEEQVERMHAELMKAAAKEDQKDKRRMLMRRMAIGVTSVATIVLIAFISMMMMNNNEAQTPETTNMEQSTEQPEAETSNAKEENEDGTSVNEGKTRDGSGSSGNENESNQNQEGNGADSESESTEESSDQSPEELVLEHADQIIEQLANNNYEAVSEHVHQEDGVLFSPYVNVSEEDLVFEANEVAQFETDESLYNWGREDGSGHQIELTPMEYHNDFIFTKDFTSYDERNINEFKERGSMINNINDQFPEAHVVEYFVESSEEYEGMDWRAINLVFEQNAEGEWKLVAIVNDQWTI